MTVSPNSDIFILLDNIAASAADPAAALLFSAPHEIITATDPAEIPAAFARMEQALASGHHLAGWFAYELGYHFEPRLAPLAPAPSGLPLLWVTVCDSPEHLSSAAVAAKLDPIRHSAGHMAKVADITPGISRDAYLAAIHRLRDYLFAGDIYQANFTFPVDFTLDGSPRALYRKLRRGQPVPYAAWIHAPERDVISLSPELFLDKRGPHVTARPMKGTSPRGRTLAEDDDAALTLATDPKQRAENVMIVDLLRNDLSRLAARGTVEVPSLFEVERYRSLLQMTSTVTAEIAPDLPLLTLFQNLFPCGSITGAPKIRAMEIIRELETAPRGIYTGAIGYVTPDRDICLNVPIRTLTLTPDGPARWRGRLGIGSGIVADSEPDHEYEECLLKGRFLTDPLPDFDLIETFAWAPATGYQRLEAHLARLKASAQFFAFQYDETEITRSLTDLAATLGDSPQRIRLLLATTGAVCISAAAFPAQFIQPRVTLTPEPVHSTDPLNYHKTTARTRHTQALTAAKAKGPYVETLFVNEQGQLTEGSWSTLFIEHNGELLTPPLTAGLLPGILRAELLQSGRAKESPLTPKDLQTADQIYIGNSLRGLIKVTL
ncbi:aminodeoxychorismate synthase component I [Govanella unica]|uniref:Probable branched-chain-amino-acid aminotransferase n=1 Tax=Govanella unica TaxID=2975056 RepID=A0A9X3Z8G3_9PROT|nr:aminodeoxychorismate synthase component I [Govania unica]MDA5194929.1 aminodeoxychorismate synthase component I [Govania unica]